MEEPHTGSAAMRDGTRRAPIGSGGRGRLWIIAAVALALLLWGGSWLLHRWTHVYIDDARIDGEVVTISSRVSGWITELPVIEGDEIKKGQLIARIDERDSVLHRQVLQARLDAIQ